MGPELGNSMGIRWEFKGNSYGKKGIQIKRDKKLTRFTTFFETEGPPSYFFYKIGKEFIRNFHEKDVHHCMSHLHTQRSRTLCMHLLLGSQLPPKTLCVHLLINAFEIISKRKTENKSIAITEVIVYDFQYYYL